MKDQLTARQEMYNTVFKTENPEMFLLHARKMRELFQEFITLSSELNILGLTKELNERNSKIFAISPEGGMKQVIDQINAKTNRKGVFIDIPVVVVSNISGGEILCATLVNYG